MPTAASHTPVTPMHQDHPDIDKIATDTNGIIAGIPVRETIREIFQNPANGTPDGITKAGCLALALKSNEVGGCRDDSGYVIWNAWRAAFPRACVDFSGYQSFGNDEPDFSFFQFGDYANFANARIIRARFSGAVWGDYSFFDNAVFGPVESKFQLARWGRYASFVATQWGNSANFEGAKWAEGAKLHLAQWGEDANFCAAEWLGDTYFRGARWGNKADFSDAQWHALANFEGSQWAGSAVFKATRWGGDVNLQGVSWEQLKQGLACYETIDQARQWSDERNAGPDIVHDLDFSGASFEKRLDFTGRQFRGFAIFEALPKGYEKKTAIHDQATFSYVRDSVPVQLRVEKLRETHTRFQSAPVLDRCQQLHNLQFEDRSFPKATGNKQAEIAYRSLKHAFGQQQAVREEQRFFRLEMEEERLRKSCLKRLPFTLYKCFSNYGFSLARPTLMWVTAWLAFAQVYGGYFTEQMPCSTWQTYVLQCNWLSFSLQQALPLPGFDKFGHGINGVPVGLLILHKSISLTALYLIGLALRNLFKLK